MNEELLQTRLRAVVEDAGNDVVDPAADIERGRRSLRRRRRLVVGASVAATAVVVTAGVGVGQLAGTDGADDRGAPVAGPERSHQGKTKPPTSSVHPSESTLGSIRSDHDPAPGIAHREWRYQLYDLATAHLDPKHQHLNYDTDSLQGAGGANGAKSLGIKLGWSAPSEAGEGVIQIAVASPNGRRLIHPCAYFGPCRDERVAGHGTVVMSGEPDSGSGYAVIVTQADGEYVQVIVDPLFGNNALTPTQVGLVDLEKVLALAEDPTVDLP